MALWLWTPYLLLGKRVARARLRVTAVLTAASVTALSLVSIVYMPHVIASSADRFGAIGIAMALVSWLIGGAFVIVGGDGHRCCVGRTFSASPTRPSGSGSQ